LKLSIDVNLVLWR